MKNMRKISALLLAVIMVFAMATTAFAAGNGSITINAATVDETYKLYKIFDATYAGDKVAYTFTKTEANTDLYDALVGTDSPFTLTETSDGTYNVGLKNENELGSDIGVFLKSIENKMGAPVDAKEATTTTVEFTGLDYGYYYIAKASTAQPGPTVGVTVVTPSQTINDKSTKPGTPDPDPEDPDNPGGYKIFVDENGKSQKELANTANYGDTVYFVLQAKGVNYDDGKKVVKYTAYDVLGEGFKDFSVTKVTVNGTEISNYTYTEGSPATIVIPWVNADGEHLYAPTSNIKIYCQAVVDEDAVIGEENSNTTNQGWFNWEYDNGNDGPNNPGETGFESQTVTTKVYAIALNKTDSKGNPLAGAKFEVSKGETKIPVTLVTEGDNTNASIYKYDAASTNYTVVSPASGKILIKGISSGDYTVIETEAPAGYNKMEDAIEITATEYASSTTTLTLYKDSEGNLVDTVTETVTTITFDEAAVAKNIINYTGTELPSTGGIGTTLFYIAGGLMVLVAGVLLITKKRMKYEA